MRATFVVALAFIISLGYAMVAPALPVTVITIDTHKGSKSFTVELASDHASQERGLMYRRTLAPNAGMLFDFHTSAKVGFWMKNTVLPLDILFIRANGTISTIKQNATPYSTTIIRSTEPIRAVLEINGGRVHNLGIQPGDRVHAKIF
jgi:uncharacterized membrane protein (UPF0127 family)